jgi:hypothetical protein
MKCYGRLNMDWFSSWEKSCTVGIVMFVGAAMMETGGKNKILRQFSQKREKAVGWMASHLCTRKNT